MTDLITVQMTRAIAQQLRAMLIQMPLQTVQMKRDAADLQEALEQALREIDASKS